MIGAHADVPAQLLAKVLHAERAPLVAELAGHPASSRDERVVLASFSCGGQPAEEVRQLLALELGPLLVANGRGATHELAVSCVGSDARLQVRAPGERLVERHLDLASFPADLVPRALALAGVELLAAESPAVRAQREPPAASAATALTASPRDAEDGANPRASAAPRAGEAATSTTGSSTRPAASSSALPLSKGTARWSATVAGNHRAFLGARGMEAWGAELGVERAARGPGRLAASLDAASTLVHDRLGDVRASTFSLGGYGGAGVSEGAWSGTLALGARLGLVHWSGAASEAASSSSATRLWAGPALRGTASAGGKDVGLFVEGELGLAVLTAEALAGADVVLRVRGPWLTLGAGLRFW